MSPYDSARPASNAEAWPPFSFRTGRIRSPKAAITSRDSSVEPSSTTITETAGYDCARALSIASPRNRP